MDVGRVGLPGRIGEPRHPAGAGDRQSHARGALDAALQFFHGHRCVAIEAGGVGLVGDHPEVSVVQRNNPALEVGQALTGRQFEVVFAGRARRHAEVRQA